MTVLARLTRLYLGCAMFGAVGGLIAFIEGVRL
jgi:hypothetical protein